MDRRALLLTAIAATALFGCKTATTDGPPTLGGGGPGGPVVAPSEANASAPEVFRALFNTTKGDFVVEVRRAWAPVGSDRFYNLVKGGFYDNVRFFRVVAGFMAQFGIHGDPATMAQWKDASIADDPPKQSNRRGYLTFATSGPSSRTTQVFVNLVDNDRLDAMGFSPFGQVVEGMAVVDALHAGYGDGAPRGQGPVQQRIQSEGNAYLQKDFPDLDYVKKASIQ